MATCYHCPDKGEHKVRILGNYMKCIPDEIVSYCKPCYDKLLERKREEWRRDTFKYRNHREPTQQEIERDLNSDYMQSVR